VIPFTWNWRHWTGLPLLGLLLLCLAALSVLSLQYRYGIGVTPDSAYFVSAADSLLSGNGLTTNIDGVRSPLTHHPPLYPSLLAAGRAIDGSLFLAATTINFISLLACVLAVYIFITQNASPGWAVVAALVLACSTGFYAVHYFLETDGPAIPFMLAGICWLSEFERTKQSRNALYAGLALSAAALIRYAYLAFIPAACLVIVLDTGIARRKRLQSALLLAAFACGPVFIAILHNVLVGGSATNRILAIHLIGLPRLEEGADYLSSWLLPYRFPILVRSVILGAAGSFGIVLAIRSRLKNALRITACFLLAYIGLLVVSISFFDRATPLDERLLTPAIVLLCIHLTLVCSWLWSRPSRAVRIAAAIFVLLPCCVGLMRLLPETAVLYKFENQGHSVSELRDDFRNVLPILRGLPANATIYSNVANDIYLVSNRAARNLPTVDGYTDGRPRTEAEISAQVGGMEKTLSASGGLVIYELRRPTLFDLSLIRGDDLCRRIPLKAVFRSGKFIAYRIVTPRTARGVSTAYGKSGAIAH